MKIFFIFTLVLVFGTIAVTTPLHTSLGQEQLTRTTDTEEGSTALSRIAAGQDVLRLLADLRRLVLDDSLFFDPAFQELIDYSFPLAAEPRGRPNPFAPIGTNIQRFNPEVRNLTGAPIESASTSTQTEVIVVPIGL